MPCGSSSLLAQRTVKASAYNAGNPGLIPELGRSPGEVNGSPTPGLLPGKSHGRRSLAGYSPLGHKESDTTEWLRSESGTYFLGTVRFSPKFQLYGPHDMSQLPNSALATQKQLYTLKKKKLFWLRSNKTWFTKAKDRLVFALQDVVCKLTPLKIKLGPHRRRNYKWIH